MPSFKMKPKSTAGCLREKNGLRVCQKSNMLSKAVLSHARTNKQALELVGCIYNKIDGSLSNKIDLHDEGYDEAKSPEAADEVILEFQKHVTTLTGFVAVCGMDITPAICPSNIETIFSPVVESIDNQNELEAHGNGGGKNGINMPLWPLRGANGSDDTCRSSCECQSCNVSDFYISDMFVSGFPCETCDDTAETAPGIDYTSDEPSIFSDDNYMVLPLLEDTAEPNNGLDVRFYSDPAINSDESSLYMAIHQLRSCNEESDGDRYPDWDETESFDPHMFIRNLPDLSEVSPNLRPTMLWKKPQEMKSITLVLDLDETLVHSTLEHCDSADFTFPVFINLKEHTVYVKQRPHLSVFLERVAEMFQIIVFTASQSIYAKQLLDILDPDGKLISRRAYRESCIFSDGSYTKDLTVLGVDLAKIAIIDNSPQVFRLQVNNGIPIKSWFDDPSDCALISLLPFLETLVDADDVRPIIAKRFGNKE